MDERPLHRGGWEVRWRDSAGKQRSRRFPEEGPARAFDDALAEVSPVMRRTDTVKHGRSDGIYPYGTAGGVRWRFVYRRSDGTQTTKPASWRSRLRTTRSAPLAICLNNAVKDGLTVANPALLVGRLPAAHIERDYLRLEEIPRYLDACSDLYRPLAETLIGSGLRISEALALRPSDLELELTGGRIIVYRSRRREGLGSTKSDRFRSVEIGPGLSGVLRDVAAIRTEAGTEFLFVMPAGDAGSPTAAGRAPDQIAHSTARPSSVTRTSARFRTPRCSKSAGQELVGSEGHG